VEDNINNIDRLKDTIEKKVGCRMRTPKDFDFLAEQIFETLHETVSPTTLKRLWGYLSEARSPRQSTLNILSQFVGYNDWEAFCNQKELPTIEHQPDDKIKPERNNLHSIKLWQIGLFAVLLISASVIIWLFSQKNVRQSEQYVLKKGQVFATYRDYLSLFGIEDTTNYWGKVLPHHPYIVLWGPEYHHPHWLNEGDTAKMMPTITEHWAPLEADSLMINMKNRDKFNHEKRLNEIRITFMKNLKDSTYVFLGVYRLSLSQSDITKCVWERVSEQCDLNNLNYLNELRN